MKFYMPCMVEYIYNPSTSEAGSRESPKFEASLTYIASFRLKNKNKKPTVYQMLFKYIS